MIENIFSIIYNVLKEEIMKNYKDNLKNGEKKVKGFFVEFPLLPHFLAMPKKKKALLEK